MVDLSRRATEDSETKPKFWMRMKSMNCVIKFSKTKNRWENWIYWRLHNQETHAT